MYLGYLRETAMNEAEFKKPKQTASWISQKLWNDHMKVINRLLKDAKKENDPKKKKALYKDALAKVEEAKKQAKAVPDDTILDYVYNYCMGGIFWFLNTYKGLTSVDKGKSMDNFSSGTRDTTIYQFEMTARTIRGELKKL